MQRPVAWLAALLLVACSDRHPLDPTASRMSPASVSHDVVVTDPNAAYGVMLNSTLFTLPIPLGNAVFGPQVTSTPEYVLDAHVVRTPAGSSSSSLVPGDGCEPFSGDYIAGNIVLIDRGPCLLTIKVLNAQNAGAVGVIIRDNNTLSTIPFRLGGGDPAVVIPAFSIPLSQGTTLATAIVQSGPVPVRLAVSPVDAPTVHLPADIDVNATSSGGAIVRFSVFGTAYHDLGGVSCSRASGATFPVGTTTVTCTTIDIWGNSASGDFHVTVRPLDTTPPTINVPGNIAAELTSPNGAAVPYQVVAVDDDGQPVVATCTPPSGSVFPFGSTIVSCTATDAAGNTSQASFTVTILDTTAPSLAVSPNVTADATSPAGASVNYAVTATDLSGSATVTCTPTSGATFQIGITSVVCQAQDPSGNTATGSFTVTVKGASAQINDLQRAVAGLDLQDGTETSVQAKLSAALGALSARNLSDACGSLGALINQINAQTGKKISLTDAQALMATVQRIRSAAGC
jgi:HYR domain/PA domain